MSRTLPTIRVRPVATSIDNPVRRSRTIDNAFRVRHSEFTFLYHPSTISTMSNSIDQPYLNNVELHRPTVFQQCRTPSTNRMSTMSNSIDQLYINNVELHRPTVPQQCRTPSTNQQCRTPSAVALYVKSSNVELYRPSRITVPMVPPSTMSNSDTAN